MNQEKIEHLKKIALRTREHIIRLSTNGGCFIGASLSCADLLTYLYAEFLNVNQNNLRDPERDYLFLSKGHDVPALYGVFVELGLMEEAKLKDHLKPGKNIYWHPNRNVPGVEFHSGSLGHLPAVGLGVALDCKLRGQKNKVIVITGDGELNEGSVWEAILVAQAKHLDNYVLVVDRNHFQANIATEELLPLEPLKDKFVAFGCSVHLANGHDFGELQQVFSNLPFSQGKPMVVIADTVRGKGLPSIEARADRWFCNFNEKEIEDLLKELHGAGPSKIESETLVVR